MGRSAVSEQAQPWRQTRLLSVLHSQDVEPPTFRDNQPSLAFAPWIRYLCGKKISPSLQPELLLFLLVAQHLAFPSHITVKNPACLLHAQPAVLGMLFDLSKSLLSWLSQPQPHSSTEQSRASRPTFSVASAQHGHICCRSSSA